MGIDYRSVILEQSAAMVDIVRRGPLDAPVPGCPDWSLAELAVHMGSVQRWSTKIVTTGVRPEGHVDEVVAPPGAADYLAAGAPGLVAALDDADLDAPCWNFSGHYLTKGFWLRRQALEVSFHRWDAASAVDAEPAPIDAEVAADGIDEFLRMVVRRVIARTKADTTALVGDVHVHCTDTHGEWTFAMADGDLQVTDGHTKASAAVRGPASDLALYLYNRLPVDRVERFGDTDLVDRYLQIVRF